MNRDKKRGLVWYQVDDTEAIARYLEKMAAKGWLLEGIDNWWYTYRRAEPVQVKYAATFFPEASVYDPAPTEGQETYIDYCQAAGWELAAVYGPFQYFRSTRPDPVPIETDESARLAAVRRTMRKSFVLTYALLLLIPLVSVPLLRNQIRWSPMSFFSSVGSLAHLTLIAAIALCCIGFLVDYLVWVLRSKRSVDRGGSCVKPHTRARLWATAVMLAVCVAVVAVYFMDMAGLRTILVLLLAMYGGMMLLSRWVLRRLKERGTSRGNTRGLMIALAVAAGIVMGFAVPVLFGVMASTGMIHTGREPMETYTKTYENVSWTYTQDVFYDDLPVTLEDLGYAVTPEDHCTYEAEVSRSPLAVHGEYTQEALSSDSKLPRLTYQTFETRWSWLLDMCWEKLLQEDPYEPMEELVPAPWGAEAAYRQDWLYLLRYQDRIVTFRLLGDDAAPWQLDIIAQALRT